MKRKRIHLVDLTSYNQTDVEKQNFPKYFLFPPVDYHTNGLDFDKEIEKPKLDDLSNEESNEKMLLPPQDLRKIYRMNEKKINEFIKDIQDRYANIFNEHINKLNDIITSTPNFNEMLDLKRNVRRQLDVHLEMYKDCVDNNRNMIESCIEKQDEDFKELSRRIDYLCEKIDGIENSLRNKLNITKINDDIQTLKSEIAKLNLIMPYGEVENIKEYYEKFFKTDYHILKKEIDKIKSVLEI